LFAFQTILRVNGLLVVQTLYSTGGILSNAHRILSFIP